MYLHRLEFSLGNLPRGDLVDLVDTYLGTLRMNGQVCGREWPLFIENRRFVAIVSTPEQCSLDEQYNSTYTKKWLSEADKAGISITSYAFAEDIESAQCCTCNNSSSYVLFTTYLTLEPPIRCLDCFGPVPLYRFPALPSGEFYEVISWQSDYQSCDSLQMNCEVLEKSATRQLSHIHSQLTNKGRSICQTLAERSGKHFYYYLYRGHGKSLSSEQKRPCPSCGDVWYSKEKLHSRFHFKCDRCRLLSNVAWNIHV